MKSLKIQSLIASIFSVIFSLSIAKQLIGIVSDVILVVLFLFTILFLIYNENRKVNELRRLFTKRNANYFTIVFTLFISISLSSIGIFLWTNQSMQKGINNENLKAIEITKVENEYNHIIDSVRSSSINTEEYNQLKTDIEWWKGRRPANLKERSDRNNQIAILQERLSDILTQYSKNKQDQLDLINLEKQSRINQITSIYEGNNKKLTFDNYISLIFIILVLITEFVIYNIQKEIGRYLIETDSKEIKVIEDLLNQGLSKITLDDVIHNPFAESLDYKKTKKLFNLLFSLNILTDQEKVKNGDKMAVYGKFIAKDQAIKKLREYYFKANNLKK